MHVSENFNLSFGAKGSADRRTCIGSQCGVLCAKLCPLLHPGSGDLGTASFRRLQTGHPGSDRPPVCLCRWESPSSPTESATGLTTRKRQKVRNDW